MAQNLDQMNSRWSLLGMTALVTGGTKGPGKAVVEELASFGASVHTCASNKSELKDMLHEWQQLKGFSKVSGSVSSPTQRELLINTVSSLFKQHKQADHRVVRYGVSP